MNNEEHRAVQIIEHVSPGKFEAKKKELQEIYGKKDLVGIPLVVLCIAGAARQGKNPTQPWQINDATSLSGFKFCEGEDRTTLGIWVWNHIFIIQQEDGTKVGVSLMDSQGTFDNNTSYQDCSTIFAMPCLFSSIMCYNVFNDLQEDKLNDLAAFVDHARTVNDNLGGTGKLFQDLVFIIRDFRHKKYLDDEQGGQIYIEKVLGDVQVKELQQLRDGLNSSYERKFGFVFYKPGDKVEYGTTTEVVDINPKFVYRAKEMVETLLPPFELQVKRVGPSIMYCQDMCDYILLCVRCFNDNQEFAPKAVLAVNRVFLTNLEVGRASKSYDSLMKKAFVNCETGYSEEKLDGFHNKFFGQVQDDIVARVHNEVFLAELAEKCDEEIKRIFITYKEKNELLVEQEKKRVQMIEEKRRHEENLARQKAEAVAKLEQEKMEHERK
uniref:Guanylate-binding protein N-terminal domain-containing protein n=1 Tax=Panagrolaimus sp. ES5 TaxID=591445 RepID=A0AC34F2F3_9BILA